MSQGGVPGALLRDWVWLSWSCTCRRLVMYLSWTRRIPALVTRRITRPQGPVAAAVSEVFRYVSNDSLALAFPVPT